VKSLSLLKNPWFIGGLGIAAISSIVYFIGPLIGIGDARPLAGMATRWVVIVLLILGWVIFQLLRQMRAAKASAQISSGIVAEAAGADDSARSAEEVAALKARFEEAVEVLRKSDGGKGKSLYDLPWYIIIGPPGAGKTTALVNSGLRFPLAERFGKNALRGVGGTRNCDWWFTDEAVLLDTAGRFTTQDSHASADKAAWEGFLELLQRYRKRRPINGVLVAISATDFMTMDAHQRRQQAAAIKDRIRELDGFFGMRFPVYVLVTKCDLINGFVDYFDDLDREQREQVWGVTLPMVEAADGDAAGVARLADELDALFARLDQNLIRRLQQERDVKRRAQIYSFPRQIGSLKAPLMEFLEEVFRSSRFEQAAMLRGVYFTSGTQEGTPIDRVMGAISRTFGLEQQALPSFAGQGRSYFITRLLQGVVFQESGIAGTNQKVERRRALLQRVAYAGSFVVVAMLIAGWIVSYFGNLSLIEETRSRLAVAEQAVAEIPRNRVEPEVALPALDALRSLAETPRLQQGLRFSGLGLSQADNLAEQAEAAYRRALINELLPRVMVRLEQQVASSRPPLEYTYEALKTYLRLGLEKHFDAELIGAWVTLDWEARLPRELGSDKHQALTQHLAAMLEQRPTQLPLPMDEEVIRQARQRLLQIPLEQRIYSRLKGSRIVQGLPDFTVLDRAGPESLRVFVRDSGTPLSTGIPAFFTRAGYERIFGNPDSYQLVEELTSEQWVLRDEGDASSVKDIPSMLAGLQDLYFADYIKEYRALIQDVQLAPFRDSREAARILNVLSQPANSPLTNLITAIQQETDFSSKLEVASTDGNDDAFAAQRERLQQALGQVESSAVNPRASRHANVVEEAFSEFRDLGGAGDASAPVQNLVNLLRELADFMLLVASEESVSGIPHHLVQRGQATLQKIKFEAERQEQPLLKGLLDDAATSASNIAFGGVATNIDAQWRSGPLAFCQRAVSGRYPVDPAGRSEIRLEDFGRFFGYGGELDQFFQAYLKDHIDTSQRPWRASGRTGVQLSGGAIAQFERAQAIRETFFRGDAVPHVGFELTPISMDSTITQFSMSINGQTIQYFHGPRVSQSFSWPGGDGVGEVRLEVSPSGGVPMRTERGPWSWFRILEEARMSESSVPEHFQVVFELGGRTVTYELVARSAYNPFKLRELREFSCPSSLTSS